MILKKENPRSVKRCNFLKYCHDNNVPISTLLKLTALMRGKSDEEKELIAEKLLKIVESSQTEDEMIAKAEKSFLK